MTLEQFLRVLHDTQNVELIYEGLCVSGKKEALDCMLCEDIYAGTVVEVGAYNDVLKVYGKEKPCTGASDSCTGASGV